MKVTPVGGYVPYPKLHLISQICYCCQISLQSAAVNCSFSDKLTPLEETFILLVMVLV